MMMFQINMVGVPDPPDPVDLPNFKFTALRQVS